MASDDRGGVPPLEGDGLISNPDTLSVSDSESGSSYIGSTAPSPPAATICHWRTERYHDQECERFFDCPTHIVERAPSESGERDIDNEDGSSIQPVDNTQDPDPPTLPNPLDDSRNESYGTGLNLSNEETQTYLAHIAGTHSRRGSHADEETNDNTSSVRTADSDAGEDRVPSRPPSRSSLHRIIEAVPTGRSGDITPSSTNEVVRSVPSPSTSQVNVEPTSTSPVHRLPPPVSMITRPENSTSDTGSRRLEMQRNMMVAASTGPGAGSSYRRANQEHPVPQPPGAPIIPRWQPDNEVTFCPICRTQFSIFVRKHHCRKCGRVVCNSCSPHRIVIPYQFIVQPPGYPRVSQRYPSSFISGDGGYSDFSGLGGGERVRLCNPCVPDPNITPHQAHGQGLTGLYSPHSPQSHVRSQSGSNTAYTYQSVTGPVPHPGRVAPIFSSRNRSVTMATQQPATSHRRPPGSRILSGTPPTPRPDYLSMGSASTPSVVGPPTARYEIPEEDECPVCHRELPPRSLPNFEAQREAHITVCIQAHSQFGPGSPSTASPGGVAAGEGNSTGTRRATTGMFPYTATEKDCVDSAECTICLEEFEVGVPMARLECLCRFHKACILAWWESHPGRCPVHQHDGYGF